MGERFDYGLVRQKLAERRYGWVWAVHCETSTGILNDIARLQSLCRQAGAKFCLDAVSSIGLVEVDLSPVFLASGVSGKGLGAFPGLAMVYHNHTIEPQPDALPRYLDLGYFAVRDGVPFTISSNLLHALKAALERLDIHARSANIRRMSRWCRDRLAEIGLNTLAVEQHSNPAVLSVVLPPHVESDRLGEWLRGEGYLLSYASPYLCERNLIRICLFSDIRREQLWPLFQLLERAVSR